MKCFVASAFGKADVDAIYDRCLVPTLKSLGIQAVRVDRVEHNEDIDKKILALLDEADLALADLTYARPSVYYEAGYAAGSGKPVIFTARGDHFRARDSDPEGLLRVHFDLQMKNIISWKDADPNFSARLEKRIQLVLKPMLKRRQIDHKLELERSAFARRSQDARIGLLNKKAGDLLKARAFRLPKPLPGRVSRYGAFNGMRELGQFRQEVRVVCMPTATRTFFNSIEMLGSVGVGYDLPVKLHYVVVTLDPVPRARIVQALPSFERLEDGTFHSTHESERHPEVQTYVHAVDGVRSESEFTEAFRSILKRYALDRNRT